MADVKVTAGLGRKSGANLPPHCQLRGLGFRVDLGFRAQGFRM